jgi:hypothetical protein
VAESAGAAAEALDQVVQNIAALTQELAGSRAVTGGRLGHIAEMARLGANLHNKSPSIGSPREDFA